MRQRLVFLLLALGATSAYSASVVTSWTTTAAADTTTPDTSSNLWIDGNGTNNDVSESPRRLIFDGNYSTVSTFVAYGNYYDATSGAAANAAFIRRGAAEAPALNAVNMMTLAGSMNNTNGQYTTPSTAYGDVSSLLLSGSLQNTIADAFANATVSGADENDGGRVNTERIDYVWNSPYTVTGTEVITIFNLDPIGNQDEFRIALFTSMGNVNITGLGTQTSVPSAYASAGVVIRQSDYNTLKLPLPIQATNDTDGNNTISQWNNVQFKDSGNPGGSPNYDFKIGVAGSNAVIDNQLTGATAAGIGGIAIKLTELGVSVGQTIRGYSLMSTDVTPTGANAAAKAASLVNWGNTDVYPICTDNDTGGTADFVTFGGRFIQPVPVPEPGTYGLLAVGGLTAFAVYRRQKIARQAGT